MAGFRMTLAEAAKALGVSYQGDDVLLQGVSTDSRQLEAGQLFVALSGPNFDGHDYLQQAIDKGAAAVLVERKPDIDIPYLQVDDTRLAMGQLASAWRQRFDIPLVAVTGSNGKTTVKEMLASIFRQQGETLSTRGNLNNDIGVPLTLFRLDESHGAAVIEMGANHAGEIDYLTRLAKPTVALITNAAAAHLEGFGSLLGVAEAKGEIYDGLSANGKAIINADDPFAYLWFEFCEGRQQLSFALEKDADVSAEYAMTDQGVGMHLKTPVGRIDVLLPLLGRHNVMNALAAIAAALAAGVELSLIAQGLSAMQPVNGRMQLKPGVAGSRIIDDTYNANPASLQAGISVLVDFPGEHYLALGDMGELGEDAAELHRQAGQQAKQMGVQRLYGIGELAQYACHGFQQGASWFEHREAMIAALRKDLHNKVTLLVKGSRLMHMETVAAALTVGAEA